MGVLFRVQPTFDGCILNRPCAISDTEDAIPAKLKRRNGHLPVSVVDHGFFQRQRIASSKTTTHGQGDFYCIW